MEKYKKNRKLIEIKCDICGLEYLKPESEYKRNITLNRKSYCSRSCSGKSIKNINHLEMVKSTYDISKHSNNLKDEFTDFRFYFRKCKSRNKEFNLTLIDLKNQWELQKGICPYTKFNLELNSGNKKIPYHLKASLDRIDSNVGYIKGNIEFISLPINYMKNNQFTKKETIDFLNSF